jgi:hypothetical protein
MENFSGQKPKINETFVTFKVRCPICNFNDIVFDVNNNGIVTKIREVPYRPEDYSFPFNNFSLCVKIAKRSPLFGLFLELYRIENEHIRKLELEATRHEENVQSYIEARRQKRQ